MFDLTTQERRVILFLASVAMLGLGVNFLSKRYAPLKAVLASNADSLKIDLNSAAKEELVAVPGIGEKLAQRIIEYREGCGRFSETGELRKVRGITPYRYEKIKEYLTVR